MTRLLSLLSLLQTPREWPGGELASRLGVSLRTVRRDVERLRGLGYPVEATMGAAGGYRMAAGATMPPLLLEDDEAVAIAIGLRTAAGHAVEGIEEAAVRALAKLEQVLPKRLRHRVAALGAATQPMLTWERPTVDPELLTLLAGAVTNRERVRFGYRTYEGAEAPRRVEPHRLVSAGRRWYLVGWDTDRDDWRIFRVDRIAAREVIGYRAVARELPDGGDAAAFVTRKLTERTPVYRAVATLHAPVERMAGLFSGDVEPIDAQTCLLRDYSDTLDFIAWRLMTLGCDFEVHEPPELIARLAQLGARASRAAGALGGPRAAG